MSNEKDYREKIEKHRQEVELDEVTSRRTRTRRNQKNKKQAKSPLLSILVFTFILIPLAILVYVWFIYEPEVETKVERTKESPIVQIEKMTPFLPQMKKKIRIKQRKMLKTVLTQIKVIKMPITKRKLDKIAQM